jgi:hypothetical protein
MKIETSQMTRLDAAFASQARDDEAMREYVAAKKAAEKAFANMLSAGEHGCACECAGCVFGWD